MDMSNISESKIEPIKTGTITIGIVCKDGIVLAADKRATADHFIANKRETKIAKLTENIVVTTAGGVSDIQMIVKLTRAELELKRIRTKQFPFVHEAANLFASVVYQNIRKMSPIIGVTHFVLGGADSQGFGLYDIYPDGSLSKVNDYVTSGAYGRIMGYGILENEWKPNLTLEEGKKLALKVARTAAKRDSSVGNGVNIVVIDKNGVGKITEEKIE